MNAQIPIANPPRPSVIQLAIKEKGALYAAYIPLFSEGGIFIPTWKFTNPDTNTLVDTERGFQYLNAIPIPSLASPFTNVNVPYIAFDYQGRLTSGQDEVIPLAQGSIFLARDSAGGLTWGAADALETPPSNSVLNFNRVRVDYLTGRARIERQEVVP